MIARVLVALLSFLTRLRNAVILWLPQDCIPEPQIELELASTRAFAEAVKKGLKRKARSASRAKELVTNLPG